MRMKIKSALQFIMTGSLVCVMMFTLVGCVKTGSVTTVDSNWWMFQADLAHTGYSPGTTLIPPLELKWDRILVTGTVSLWPPVFGRDKIFIGSGVGDAKLYALSQQDGSTVWSFSAPMNGFLGAPVYANDKVYAATIGESPKVYAFNADNGSLLWARPLPTPGSRASLAAGDGMVFVNTDGHRLYAFTQDSGEVVWAANTSIGETSEESSPAMGFGKIFLGSDDGLYTFDINDGQRRLMFLMSDSVGFSSPVIHTDVGIGNPAIVFISAGDRKLHAVRMDNNTEAWSFTGDADLAGGSVAVAERKVFLFNYYKITALDANTGNVIWNYQASSIPMDSPAIANGILYYSDYQAIHGIRISDGVEVWNASIPGNGDVNAPGSSLAIDKGMVVVPNKGHVYAFKTAKRCKFLRPWLCFWWDS